MTKQEIVDAVSEATGLTKVETETVMNGVMTTITESLARGERVELRGFGAFSVRQREARTGRNPRTGASVEVAEKKVPFFKMGKGMRERLNR